MYSNHSLPLPVPNCDFWYFDDVTVCARHYYLDAGIPLVIGSISLFLLLLSAFSARSKSVALPESENEPLLATSASYGTISHAHSIEEIKARHFDIARISSLGADGKVHGEAVPVYRDTMDRLRVVLEEVLLILQVGISLACFFVEELRQEWPSTAILYAKLAFWVYLCTLCTVRITAWNRGLPNLWVHSTTLYLTNWVPAFLAFRSAYIHIQNPTVYHYYTAEFAISSVLVFLNYTAKVGDRPAILYVTDKDIKPSPENVSSIFSLSTYSWVDSMISKAYKEPLVKNDVWGLREDDYAAHILKSFEAYKTTRGFTFKLVSHFKWLFAVQAFWAVVDSVLVFMPSLLLKKILEYVDKPEQSSALLAWFFVFLMPTVKIIDSVASGQSLFCGRRVCVRMRAVIIGEVYAKALRRRVTTAETTEDEKASDSSDESVTDKDEKKKGSADLGAIINLMSIDAFKVSEFCGYLHYFVSSVLMLVLSIYFLFNLLGWSALVGSFGIIFLLPVNYKIASTVSKLQKDMLAITDKRIQKINETLQSIRIIKFFAWEHKFAEAIEAIRHDEMYLLKWRSIVWSIGGFSWFLTPTLVTFISFYCYTIVAGETLTAPIAFTALSLFNLLRNPLDQLADVVSFLVQSKVSLDRVGEFLDEIETDKYEQLLCERGPNSPEIGFENANFSWDSDSANDFKLRDLSIDFKVGKLNVIIGPTGSGKTSLLMAMLGEMELTSGKVFLPGVLPRDELVADPVTGFTESVAYCSQAAWLLNDTIRNNITFDAPFEESHYNAVVDACGLSRDFEILEAGDETEIGEKGITLSGGQKQRVSLARALYSSSRTILLDDCLSAVDSHTALWIYENCITGPLMENRTCVLVSHNVALTVQQAAWIVVMENGRIKAQDTPDQLLGVGVLGDDDLVRSSVINSRSQSTVNLKDLKNKKEKNDNMKDKAAKIDAKLKKLASDNATTDDTPINVSKKKKGKLVEEESKSDGVVSLKVYSGYAKIFGGWPTWTFLLSLFIITQLIYMYQSWWLRKWSITSEFQASTSMVSIASFVRTVTSIPQVIASGYETVVIKDAHGPLYYIIIYSIIGFVYALSSTIRILVCFFGGIRASNRIFKRVLYTVLRARLRFFDATPIGRIMNRFSKDIESVDQELTPCAEGIVMTFIQCLFTLALISVITPQFLLLAFLIVGAYSAVGIFYVNTSRELKRFDSITKSPIHQHFSETLTGVATIRAYGDERRFMQQNLERIDQNSRPFFYLWVSNRWLSFRVDAIGCMVMFCSGIFVLWSIDRIDAGLAGLSLSYAIAFSDSALWIVRLYAIVEMNMNSVERLQEYLEIEQEPAERIPENAPPARWPEHGAISVKDVSLRYAPELPRVIKNVTFDVQPNEKVGIVGRTGAGKSTIITAFFRFLDPETGSIVIDGVDITKIGLLDLRQAITIIPQDPTLFTGTIRSNLDPFNQYTDQHIYQALRRVNLMGPSEVPSDEIIVTDNASGENTNKFLNLNNPVSEGGSNLSQGQRQLMCLARSLLKSPKVILLDEATASIDYQSDAKIQQTIRDEFSNSTILTIAHRLRSIIDYDKILVMDAGRVVEYDDPYTLISNQESLFHSMCENSGEIDVLVQLSKESFVAKKNKV
ncbi:hypothetical protein BABINDRAFT_37368 [Babjeviella inositovora NRRL Y-12698]|uniref:ATP-dependent bile acid permease n=1 Tax=Babjeviella inositovora NRRL Y-12698 TaxID=984486 RepID=A0A1E3QPD6_9ASCO|nr:uncharacterized protein BABINDRAFT_37368 [Babjeviella inositovora NRRL Y-12698]ODQ79563.1 hypothetical protein BABINDRAFT_37368 [Babjeviella inositovora NRRL Y-12698]